jgi:aminoglycoside phosphotransferase
VQQPPASVLDWAESAIADAVIGMSPMAGGIDAATFRLSTRSGQDVVLRVTTTDDHDDVAYQAHVLDQLATTRVPAPRAIAFAEDVDAGGRRALLQTLLPGEPTLPTEPSDTWIASLVDTVVAVQAVPVTPWMHDRVEARWRKLDELAAEDLDADDRRLLGAVLARRRSVETTPVFGHDDFWVGNTLREGDDVVGIVDWGHAGVVSVVRDVTYCAVDASLCYGLDVGDRMVELFLDQVAVDPAEVLLWTGHSVLASRYFDEWIAGWNGLGVPVRRDQAAARRAELVDRALTQLC